VPLVAHAVHEELMKHKRDVVEWGVLVPPSAGSRGGVSALLRLFFPFVDNNFLAGTRRDDARRLYERYAQG
jgi:hypothetical protein